MATTIITKHSITPGNVPTLQEGELAIQIADGILYYGSGSAARAHYPSRCSVRLSQTGHGFVTGSLLRFDGTDYVEAIATDSEHAEVIGVVSEVVDTGRFDLLIAGQVTLSGLTAGTTYYLSPSSSGSYTATEPSTTGEVSKPVMIAVSTEDAVWTNFRGIIQ